MAAPLPHHHKQSTAKMTTIAQSMAERFDIMHPPRPEQPSIFTPPSRAGYTETRGTAHRMGLWHRSVHVWVVDPAHNAALVQQRALAKDTNPGKWDVSCAGHVSAGDTPEESAVKELEEELGLEVAPGDLVHLFCIQAQQAGETRHGAFVDREFQDIYMVLSDGSMDTSFSNEEVAAVRWMPIPELEATLAAGPDNFVRMGAEYRARLFPALLAPHAAHTQSIGACRALTTAVARRQLFGFAFRYTGALRPGDLPPPRPVPPHIPRPAYAAGAAVEPRMAGRIEVKTGDQVRRMRAACRVAREVLDAAGRLAVVPGTTTADIDALVHAECLRRRVYPSPLGYHGFRASCCTSVNETVCHGVPDSTALRDGDIVNVDVTVYLDGMHGDCNETFHVGAAADDPTKHLVLAAHTSLEEAIAVCGPGVRYREIGLAIDGVARRFGFSNCREFTGHGIGEHFHQAPCVFHYPHPQDTMHTMAPGHTFTIEPMLCAGVADCVVWPDGWTATTRDGGRSAQFEHTVLVTETGVEVLTAKTENSPRQWFEAAMQDAA